MRRLAIALACLLGACGDGTFIIIVNSGVIVGPPQCHSSGGQFDLLDQGGLQVVVVITSSTRIVVSGGGAGRCDDLAARARVDVSGRQSGQRIVASSVTIL
ncbi:MAG: hypothetical protein ABI624_13685 [Casimicrobiaceae bacterium]